MSTLPLAMCLLFPQAHGLDSFCAVHCNHLEDLALNPPRRLKNALGDSSARQESVLGVGTGLPPARAACRFA